MQVNNRKKKNWLIKSIGKYQMITLTFGFLFIYNFSTFLISYFKDNILFLERYGMNFYFWAIGIPIIYFIQWLIVVWVASKFPREKLQQKFSRHPIATIIVFIFYVVDLPYRLAEYGGNLINIFEAVVYYAFISFLWWLFLCWISSKIFHKKRFQWIWYKKAIEKIFIIFPISYKIILGLIIAFLIFFIIFILLTVIFQYSGQDLEKLFSS